MRVLVAPAPYRGSLTARQAAEALARGWERGAPHDEVLTLPLSDGGEGLLDVLSGLDGVEASAVTVAGPLGGPVPAQVVLRSTDAGLEAWVEAAEACGPALVGLDQRGVGTASSYGLGQLVRAAVDAGARRVVVGVRDLLCHDGGAGLWRALADREDLHRTGWDESLVDDEGLDWLPELRRSLLEVEIVVATPEDLPLLGLQGASAQQAQAKGAPAAGAQQAESRLGELVERVRQVLPEPTDLLSGRPVRRDKVPGAGAGGGVAYALTVLGGRVEDGAALVGRTLGLDDAVARCDLVVTGEGCLDWASLRGRVVATVGEAALRHARPAVVVPGQSLVGRRETAAIGVDGIYPVADSLRTVPRSLADPAGALERRAERVARTWSPAR